jgi:hypothetical protein
VIATQSRTARKPHTCSRCHTQIQPGTRYLAAAASPNHDDLGNEGWWRIAECATCAKTCGRPVTEASRRAQEIRGGQ